MYYILYLNSLRLSVIELGFVRPTGPGPAPLTAVMEPDVTLVRIERAQPGTPGRLVASRGGCRAGSVTEGRPGPARHPPQL